MRALFALLVLSLSACSKHTKQAPVVAALDKLADAPSKMVLYSLNPTKNNNGHLYTETVFDGFDILGKAEITDRNEQRTLLRALAHGASENDDHTTLCFNARHALHIEQSGHSTDFTICFECLQVETRGFKARVFFTSASPEPTFTESIRRHNLPVPPKPYSQ